jgi:hypothetical protein
MQPLRLAGNAEPPSPSSATAAIVPPILVTLMAAFRDFFMAPVWDHVLVLVTGAVLTPGKRTVSAVLRLIPQRAGWVGISGAAAKRLRYHFDRSVVENQVELLTEGAEPNCL